MRAVILGLIVILAVNPVRAAEPLSTTQALLDDCKAKEPLQRLGCLAYIRGVSDAMQMAGAMAFEPSFPQTTRRLYAIIGICHHDPVTVGQLTQTFINWAEKNPKQWQDAPFSGVAAALQESWPCKP